MPWHFFLFMLMQVDIIANSSDETRCLVSAEVVTYNKFLFLSHRFLGDVEITEKKSVFTRVDSGNTHKIILKEVSAELAGQYTCKVSNDLGSDSCQATFTVNSK